MKNTIKWVPFIILVLLFVYYGTKRTIENYQLKRDGKCTYAYIYSKKKEGRRGLIACYYRFSHNGHIYTLSSVHDDNSEVGDSIQIVFLETNPKISRSNTFLEKDCVCTPLQLTP